MKVLKFLTLTLILAACNKPENNIILIDEGKFETSFNGDKVKLSTLKNNNGMVTQITNLGGRVVNLWVPDKNGNFADVSIGYNTAEEYINNRETYYGAIIGRYGNRIAQGQFVIEKDTFKLEQNNGGNSIHGGSTGFFDRVWEVTPIESTKLEMTYSSSDGEEGFPGNLDVKVIYELTDNNEQLKRSNGYDQNWVLNQSGDGLTLAAILKDPKSGRVMKVYTNEPGMQFYGGNFINGKYTGKYGKTLNYREALCLETQHFPDTPNQPDFPTTLLNPGDEYYSICIYAFEAE